jgi:hypothetical protein
MILSDGDLPALAACAAAASALAGGATRHAVPAVWLAGASGMEQRRSACLRQAEAYGLEVLESPSVVPTGSNPNDAVVLDVLLAAQAARERRYDTLVWPIHSGPGSDPDLDTVADSVDRALLISRLVSLGRLSRRVEVLTPYVDLNDAQIADLAADMDLPVWTCWWWGSENDGVAARARDRWMPALGRVGWVDRRSGPPGIRSSDSPVPSGLAAAKASPRRDPT